MPLTMSSLIMSPQMPFSVTVHTQPSLSVFTYMYRYSMPGYSYPSTPQPYAQHTDPERTLKRKRKPKKKTKCAVTLP